MADGDDEGGEGEGEGEGESKVGKGSFPTTHHSAIIGLRSESEAERARSHKLIANAYWRSVYKYVRLRWHRAPLDAEEITQAFFLRSLEKNTFAAYDLEKGRFRTFFRTCLEHFIIDLGRRDKAKGRDAKMVSLGVDFEAAEGELQAVDAGADPEKVFEVEWRRGLLKEAAESLRDECERKDKLVHYRAFYRMHVNPGAGGPPSYAELAAELGISVIDVTNRLSYARRAFRAILFEQLRLLTGSEEELRDELHALFETDFWPPDPPTLPST